VESIRAGLVFQLKQAVGAELIADRETALVRRAIASWRTNPAIELLGDLDADRLPIVSFRVRTRDGGWLHHNFVVALLNDLFGIQARGGCSCAGPYGHRLLGIDLDRARDFADLAANGWLGIKPGWTRLSFSFYQSEAVFDYLVAAVHMVAPHGVRLLPDYRFDPRSGLWRHRNAPQPQLRLDPFAVGEAHRRVPESVLAGYLHQARAILAARPSGDSSREAAPTPTLDRFERLRWFDLPGVCLTPASLPGRQRVLPGGVA
jgi:hypothetical protein